MKLDPKTVAVTHIYDGEEVVDALTVGGSQAVWIATFGCPRLAGQFARMLELLGDIDVPMPDRRQYVAKRKLVATVGR